MVTVGLEAWFLWFILPNLSIAKSQNQLGESQTKNLKLLQEFLFIMYIFLSFFQGIAIIIYMKKKIKKKHDNFTKT